MTHMRSSSGTSASCARRVSTCAVAYTSPSRASTRSFLGEATTPAATLSSPVSPTRACARLASTSSAGRSARTRSRGSLFATSVTSWVCPEAARACRSATATPAATCSRRRSGARPLRTRSSTAMVGKATPKRCSSTCATRTSTTWGTSRAHCVPRATSSTSNTWRCPRVWTQRRTRCSCIAQAAYAATCTAPKCARWATRISTRSRGESPITSRTRATLALLRGTAISSCSTRASRSRLSRQRPCHRLRCSKRRLRPRSRPSKARI
mmetsp:Transcript_6045/g.23952  ORF Transcript_6045/g.23952 Transcript_6045/m.23952 type:complete len:267 (-) Transcript_6045:2326-3126(-)